MYLLFIYLFILCDDIVVWDRKRRKLRYIQNETFMVVRANLVCAVVPPVWVKADAATPVVSREINANACKRQIDIM
jgi:hypothetical protein